jgi:hypothetical protein
LIFVVSKDSIFRVIGTPTEETWPGVSTLPEYKPFSIYQPTLSLIHFVPKLNNKGKDLLLVNFSDEKFFNLSPLSMSDKVRSC